MMRLQQTPMTQSEMNPRRGHDTMTPRENMIVQARLKSNGKTN
jgi:hypothetical protein